MYLCININDKNMLKLLKYKLELFGVIFKAIFHVNYNIMMITNY